MKVNPLIFKAYDIRGVYPQEVNENAAYLIGRAFVKFLKKPKLNIVVGRDGRLSSPVLFKNLVQGILDQGANVIDIGLSTSPMLYFAVAHYKYDGGINVTASHNPPKYNGFKIVKENAIPVSEKTGLRKIQAIVEKISSFSHVKCRGKIIKKKILKDYVRFNLKEINLKNLTPLKIVVDTANAVSGIFVSLIFKKTPCKIYHLFEKLDGNFPNHFPDPLIKENLKVLQKEIINRNADLGVAFDGDGDRVVFVTEIGEIIPGDQITALISDLLLKKKSGQKILYDIRSSRVVPETIVNRGGIPIITRVGHSFIKEKMRKENIVFAGEFSGHYYHREHYFCEAPLFALFKILEELSQTKKRFSELIKPYQKYFHSEEINFEIKEKEKILKRLEKKYQSGKILKLDGLRVDFKNWWFLVRPSQTEPILRLIIETETKKLLKEKKKEIIAIIQSLNPTQ